MLPWKNRTEALQPKSQPSSQNRQQLKDELQQAMVSRRYNHALDHIMCLEALEPTDPRWPHKHGDLLRSLGRLTEAAAAYRRAARRYDALGFPVRSVAMITLARELGGISGPVQIDPADYSHTAVRVA
jgi:hypothetical protein